ALPMPWSRRSDHGLCVGARRTNEASTESETAGEPFVFGKNVRDEPFASLPPGRSAYLPTSGIAPSIPRRWRPARRPGTAFVRRRGISATGTAFRGTRGPRERQNTLIVS